MTTPAPSPDLFKHWKDLYDQYEKAWTQPMQDLIATEHFSAAMGSVRDSYLTSEKAMREGMEQYLKSLHMPSKTDVTHVATLVVGVENKVEAMDDALEILTARFDDLEGHFDRLEAKLDILMAAVARLAFPAPDPVVEAVVPPADVKAEVAAAAPAAKRRAAK